MENMCTVYVSLSGLFGVLHSSVEKSAPGSPSPAAQRVHVWFGDFRSQRGRERWQDCKNDAVASAETGLRGVFFL